MALPIDTSILRNFVDGAQASMKDQRATDSVSPVDVLSTGAGESVL